jgi:hypothetical protein
MKTGATVVFSTGPAIPTLRITGTVFDWGAERTAPRALVEALTSDSIKYLAAADSIGNFVLGPLGPGTYLVRGVIDQNQNRELDRTEAWDSVRVTIPSSNPVELLAAPRDTLAARLLAVNPIDSVTLRLQFDRLLDPMQTIPIANVRLAGADSAPIGLAAVRTPREEAARAKTIADAAADSARRADLLAGRPRPAPPPVAPATGAGSRPAPATPSRPPPYTTVTVVLSRPLTPNTSYRASVTGVRALSGRVAASERQFTTPRRPPPRPPGDSTAAPGVTPTQSPAPNPAPTAVPSAVPTLPTVRPAAPPGGAAPSRP